MATTAMSLPSPPGEVCAGMDEAGTLFCFTIDGQTKEDGTIAVRNRDDAQ